MKIKALILLSSLFVAAMQSSAKAADITYQGSILTSSVPIYLSITTDGALGYLQESDIVSASASTVIDGVPVSADEASFSNTILDFTASDIEINPEYSETQTGLNFSGANLTGYVLLTAFDYTIENAAFANQNGGVGVTHLFYSTAPFAAAVGAAPVSAAPEPSTWLLMMAAIGGVGLTLRRAKRDLQLGSSRSVIA